MKGFSLPGEMSLIYNGIDFVCFRSRSVLFANLAFEDCNFHDSEANAIIEIAECESLQSVGSVRFHQVIFRDNKLISGIGLEFNFPSCSSLEMTEVEFIDNKCNGICGAVLPPENDLRQLLIEGNTASDVDDTSAILFAPEGSTTKADSIFATNNDITVVMIQGGSLEMSYCSFIGNNVSRSNIPQSACIHLIDSNSVIEDTVFEKNGAENGAAVYMNNSTLTLNDCKFEENESSFGGALVLKNKSALRVVTCNFSRNAAEQNGGAMHADKSSIVIENSQFDNQLASENAGCFRIVDTMLNCTNSSFVGNHALRGGVLLAAKRSNLYFNDCIFDDNSAERSGGMAFIEQQPKLVLKNCVSMNGNASACAVIYAIDAEMIEIRKTSFEESTAENGGGIRLYKTTAVLFDIEADSNKVSGLDGFILAEESKLDIFSSRLSSNKGNYGGIVVSSFSIVNVRDSVFRDNVATEGGVFRLFNASSLTITNTTFLGNQARYGGVMVLQNGMMDMSSCTFINNRAKESGGSIYGTRSELTITDSKFLKGKAATGGVFTVASSTLTLTNANLTQNNATSDAVIRVRDNSNVAMANVSMTRNRAMYSGGTIGCFGSTFFAANCTMSFNVAAYAGAVASISSSIFKLENATIVGNSAKESATFYFAKKTNATIYRTDFSENAAKFGGAIVVKGKSQVAVDECNFFMNSAHTSGGVFHVEDSKADIRNCNFNSSIAEVGGGIFFK